jgi:hypothetical protein
MSANQAEPLEVLLAVVAVLDRVRVPYVVGGSIASSVFGEPRASADVDLLVRLEPADIPALVAGFEPAFYVDAESIADAVRRHSSFNIIHLATMLKADLFVGGSGVLDVEQMQRRRPVPLTGDPSQLVFITGPENIVLRKLDWFRRGDAVSDRQWRDVVGVLKAQSETLDRAYLAETARATGLQELLDRALDDAGIR